MVGSAKSAYFRSVFWTNSRFAEILEKEWFRSGVPQTNAQSSHGRIYVRHAETTAWYVLTKC